MVSVLALIAAFAVGFYVGVVLMALLSISRGQQRLVRPRQQYHEGLSPLDSPSRA
jgi:hypothetical protein